MAYMNAAMWVVAAVGLFTLIGLAGLEVFLLAPWRRKEPAHAVKLMASRPPGTVVGDGTPIALGQVVSGTGDDVDVFSFQAPATTLVLELRGPTSVLAGIWTGKAVVVGKGVLRCCGVLSRGRHTFKAATPCVLQVTPADGGPYTLVVRKWTIWDNATINPWFNKFPSTC